MGGYLPLEKVYSYDPVPQGLTAEESRLVYGIQGNLWAEYIPGDEQYEYMMYPRILAIAETGWSQPERKDYPGFHARALQAVEWLQEHGYHPFDLKNEAGRRPEALTPVAHKALGKPVIYNAPYNATYAAQGEKTLTDGLRGDWTYSDGAWQGFISSRRMDVVVDLEEVADIHSIEADFIQVTGPEVYLPCEVVGKFNVTPRRAIDGVAHLPEIRSERLTLSPVRDEDAEVYARLAGDVERNRFWGYDWREDAPSAAPQAGWFLAFARNLFRDKMELPLGIYVDGALAGEAVLHRFGYHAEAEVGVRLLPEAEGKGYAAEAVRALCAYAFEKLELERVEAKHFRENARSGRSLLLAGMRRRGEDATFVYYEKTAKD